MKIALTTDHAGYEQLKEIAKLLDELGHEWVDYGPKEFDIDDDYPDFIFPAARAVAKGECDRGIIMGGSGQGEAIAANRFAGVRCALFYGPTETHAAINAEGDTTADPYIILRLSREHNVANVLSLGARFLTIDQIREAVRIWLGELDGAAERHLRRAGKLAQEGTQV